MNWNESDNVLEMLKAQDATRRFVTTFWEHSLLDQETRDHREKFKEIARDTLEGAGLTDDDYVAVPVGGIRWAVVDTSDFDAVVGFDKKAFSKMDASRYRELRETNDFDEQQRLVFDINEDNLMKGIDLLFTPDDYLVGNIEAARKMRLEMMEVIRESGGETFWRDTIDRYFRRSFVWWDLNVYAPPGKEREIALGKRAKRINDRLLKRAAMSPDREGFIRDFDISRRMITLPKFEDYDMGLKAGSGSLVLDSRYVQKGID